ncbi:MAG: hypothetical protein ACPHAS_05790, partial [Synechococcus sp.]
MQSYGGSLVADSIISKAVSTSVDQKIDVQYRELRKKAKPLWGRQDYVALTIIWHEIADLCVGHYGQSHSKVAFAYYNLGRLYSLQNLKSKSDDYFA